MFPQDTESAMSDLPEADLAEPLVRERSNSHLWNSRIGAEFIWPRRAPSPLVGLCCGDFAAVVGSQKPLVRQIQHAAVLESVFPQGRKTAVLHLPGADPTGPMFGKSSMWCALHGLANSLP